MGKLLSGISENHESGIMWINTITTAIILMNAENFFVLPALFGAGFLY